MEECIIQVTKIDEEGKLKDFIQQITYGEYLAIKAILNIDTRNHTKIIEKELKLERHAKLC